MPKPRPLDLQIQDLKASLKSATERAAELARAAQTALPTPIRQVPSEAADTYLED